MQIKFKRDMIVAGRPVKADSSRPFDAADLESVKCVTAGWAVVIPDPVAKTADPVVKRHRKKSK